MQNTFTLEYWLDEGWYVGRLKGIPGIFSQGETLVELEENIREAYRLMLKSETLPKLTVKSQEKEVKITL